MNTQILILLAACLWIALMTGAYFREYIRRKRLLLKIEKLLSDWTLVSENTADSDIRIFCDVMVKELEIIYAEEA